MLEEDSHGESDEEVEDVVCEVCGNDGEEVGNSIMVVIPHWLATISFVAIHNRLRYLMVSGCTPCVANRNSMVALQGIQTTLFPHMPLLHWALVLVLSQAPSLALVPPLS